MKDNPAMIPFERAHEIVMGSAFSTGTETIAFTDSLNRILAVDVFSDMDIPPFNKSAVDGFACRKSELERPLTIVETIPAGVIPVKEIAKGQCSRIMTGAMIPSGADCVIMVEDTEQLPSGKIRFKGSFTKENIGFKGEDITRGAVVLKALRPVRPQDIAVMASVGYTSAVVSKKPRVAVISSGNELVEPHENPGISQIRNSNASQLTAQVARAGASARYYGIAGDNEDETFGIVKKALVENDLMLITGGVSMGDFDFVPSVLERAGVRILFTRVAVQPGKPTTFGVHEKALVFGLPGNPVSSFVVFELLARPLISQMMGYRWQPEIKTLPMKIGFSRKFAERMAWLPVVISDDGSVMPVDYHGSAHISALPGADGIISVPAGIKTLERGELVNVRQI